MRRNNINPKLLLLLAEVIAFAVLAFVAVGDFGLGDSCRLTLACLLAYLVPRVVLSRARGASFVAHAILLLLAVLLVVVDYTRLLQFTFFDGYSLRNPDLRSQGDTLGFYMWAVYKCEGTGQALDIIFPGYPMLFVAIWKITGVNVVWPMALNMMFTLVTVTLTGMTTRRVLSRRVQATPGALLAMGMALCCLLMHLLVISTRMLKDGPVCAAMAIAGYALAGMCAVDEGERRYRLRDYGWFAVACALTGFVRTTSLYFIVLGVAVVTVPHWRRDWRLAAAMMAAIALSLLGGNLLAAYSFDRHAEIAGGGWNMQRFYATSESQQFLHGVLDHYFLRPMWYKVLVLPLTMAVQFISPLPWVYYESPTFTHVLSRMTYGWYLVGGTALFYYVVVWWRRGRGMGAWAWWAALCYAALAYVVAGSVSRYTIAFQPLFVPVAVFVLCRLREGKYRKAFIVWSVCFVLAIASALLLCLEIQQNAISKLLHTQSLVNRIKGLPY